MKTQLVVPSKTPGTFYAVCVLFVLLFVCCLCAVCVLFVCCLLAVCLVFVCCLCAVCVLFVCCLFASPPSPSSPAAPTFSIDLFGTCTHPTPVITAFK